jgi:hypothetical protein
VSKRACKNKDFEEKENPKFVCGKCGAKVKKEEKVCKPLRIDLQN